MKYLVLCITALVFSLTFTSCSDDDDEPIVSQNGKRLVSKIKFNYSNDEDDGQGEYIFSYDKSGKITAMEIKYSYLSEETHKRCTDVERYTYSVSGNKLTVQCVYEDGEYPEYNGIYGGTFMLNDNGFVISGEEIDEDEDEFTYTCYYDDEDHLSRMEYTRNGYEGIINYIWNDGDISRGIDGSQNTYYEEENKANIEFLGLDKWLLGYDRSYLGSIGYLGKMNKHLCKTHKEDGEVGKYTYSFDHGYVTKITVEHEEYMSYYEIEYK